MKTEPAGEDVLARRAESTLTEQLSARFAERIRQRLLAPGARLPSVRECARRHRVSPHTVVAAYDQLLALGLVDARRHRGFFVRDTEASGSEDRARRELFGEGALGAAREDVLTGGFGLHGNVLVGVPIQCGTAVP